MLTMTAPAAPIPPSSGRRGLTDRVHAADGTLAIASPLSRRHPSARRAAMRVVLADDAAVLREGLARMLVAAVVEVSAQASASVELLAAVAATRPDVAVVDIRMRYSPTCARSRAARRVRGTATATTPAGRRRRHEATGPSRTRCYQRMRSGKRGRPSSGIAAQVAA